MQFLRSIAAVTVCLLFLSAAPAQFKALGAAETKACLAKGGRVTILTLGGDYACELPMKDAGKSCTDGSQCQGHACLLNEALISYKKAREGMRAPGICTPTDHTPSGRWTVSCGKLDPLTPTI